MFGYMFVNILCTQHEIICYGRKAQCLERRDDYKSPFGVAAALKAPCKTSSTLLLSLVILNLTPFLM